MPLALLFVMTQKLLHIVPPLSSLRLDFDCPDRALFVETRRSVTRPVLVRGEAECREKLP